MTGRGWNLDPFLNVSPNQLAEMVSVDEPKKCLLTNLRFSCVSTIQRKTKAWIREVNLLRGYSIAIITAHALGLHMYVWERTEEVRWSWWDWNIRQQMMAAGEFWERESKRDCTASALQFKSVCATKQKRPSGCREVLHSAGFEPNLCFDCHQRQFG